MTTRDDVLFAFTPLIIIGAGRSGTNALRDALTRLPGFATWPCDEINPIWCHGNIARSHDEFGVAQARPTVRRYIRRAFMRIWQQQGQPKVVVEKTCANTLRVPFIDAVLPEALYLHIVRDGVDVVASAQKRWKGELEVAAPSYFLAKARYAPLLDLPVYGFAFLKSRIAMALGRKPDLGNWGPRYDGMTEFANASISERVARQWLACVEKSDAAFDAMAPGKVLYIRYEDFTVDPIETLRRIVDFTGMAFEEERFSHAAGPVCSSSVGKGRQAEELSADIKGLLSATLSKHGYS